jgi:hypothetical protein
MTQIEKTGSKKHSGEKETLRPWLFNHRELIQSIETAPEIDRKKLANILNYLHFKGEHPRVLMNHPSSPDEILVDIISQPCLGNILLFQFEKNTAFIHGADQFKARYLILFYEQSIIIAPVDIIEDSDHGFSMPLPEKSFRITDRQYPRFSSSDVKADLWQNGFQAAGDMIDFTANAFRLRVSVAPPSSFHWFNKSVPSQIRLYNDGNVLYSGNCKSLYEKHDGTQREIVFAPLDNTIQRFRPKSIRNPRRQNLLPLHAVFEHPFTKKTIQHPVFDVSTSGFSLLDQLHEITLFPGMIIPKMAVSYAGIVDLQCRAQVIYRSDETDGVRFGIAILDMDMTDFKKLFQIINNANGPDEGMLNRVNLDELWEFLFDTDFIYPQKYGLIQNFKDEFKDVYKRLYDGSPDIASYFTYQKNGRIYGHISMVRAYEKTWFIHHLAARPLGGRPIGLAVLKQMLYFLNDVNHLPSANMDFVAACYRPGNKFPEKMFGGFAEYHGDSRHCSVDLFAYMAYPESRAVGDLPSDWFLKECPDCDSFEFEQFNRKSSGGLFPAIVRRMNFGGNSSIDEHFSSAGFTRGWKMFVLYHLDSPKVFIIDEKSDIGLNLSNLLNGIKIFVQDEDVAPELIFAAISQVRKIHAGESLSLMVYPAGYAHKHRIDDHMKEYVLWILDMQYGNEFVDYLGRKFRIRM